MWVNAQCAVIKKYNSQLTAEEIMSMLIHAEGVQISKLVGESFIMERRGCEWTCPQKNLASAVDKMSKFLVQTKRK